MSAATEWRPEAGEWRRTAEWDWTWLDDGDDNVIHAVGSLDNEATADDDWHGVGTTECGQAGTLWIPGIFSRMAAPRCEKCCEATGMPTGDQSPKNIDVCRPVAEARIAALGLTERTAT